jgi:hypothetical protein
MALVVGGSTHWLTIDLRRGGPLDTGDALGLLGRQPRVDMATTGGSEDGDLPAYLAHWWQWGWWFRGRSCPPAVVRMAIWCRGKPGHRRFIPNSGLGVGRNENARWEATRARGKSINSAPDWPNGEPSTLTMPFERQIRESAIAILTNQMKCLLERWISTTITAFSCSWCFEEPPGDALTRIVLKAQQNNLITRLVKELIPNGIIVLQYADDTIVCLEHDVEKAKNVKLLLYMFEQMFRIKD